MNENQNEYVDINAHDNYPDSEQKIEIPTMKVIPLKKICMTIGELPNSYLETMTYYEMLVWFIEFLKNNIIPTINNNASAIQEVQKVVLALQGYINNYKDSIDSDVEELEEYMNNYFENLDVQEEINNKLDQMLEDGVLTEIIQQFLQSTAIWCFDNVADMKQATNLINGSYVRTLGYYSVNDGGGAIYKITDTEDSNEFQVNVGSLYATLIIEKEINALQIGCKTNDSNFNNYTLLNKAFNYGNINVYIPTGSYYIANEITVLKSKKIYGNGQLIFTNSSNDGLILGDSIIIDGLEINTGTAFTGKVLTYNGEIGERTYPSIARFSNLVISSNSDEQIECLFDFIGYRNYGIMIDNIILGKQTDTRKANYGFKCDTNNWINQVYINQMLIDITGNNIIPFYLNNTNNNLNSYWNINNLAIQTRDAVYTYFFYMHNYQFITINNSNIYDKSHGTYPTDNVIYDHCTMISVTGSPLFRLLDATITNAVSITKSYEGYSTSFNGSSINNVYDGFNLSSYTDKIVPLFFPNTNIYNNRSSIELMTRYISGNYGCFFKCISNCGSTNTSSWYNRNFYLECNKYKITPNIQKIENVYEGTIIWVRGGQTIYYYSDNFNTPSIGIGKVVTELNTANTKTLEAENITESTTFLPATTYPLFFYEQKIIDSTTFSKGS